MGWSFRKSFSVLPGVRINLSRRGISTSLGVKGARVVVGGGRKPRLSIGRGMFRYTKTLGVKSMEQPQLPSRTDSPGVPFDPPPRGRYEANATIFQKRKLEEMALRRADLSETFYQGIDALGREQADYIITYCERQENEAYLARLYAERQRANRKLLWGIPFAAVAFGLAYFYTVAITDRPTDSKDASRVAPTAVNSSVPATPQTRTPAPQPVPARPSFAELVNQSQKRAVTSYPDLGRAGTRFNITFLNRHAEWKNRADLRLTKPDWPEVLADDCAVRP